MWDYIHLLLLQVTCMLSDSCIIQYVIGEHHNINDYHSTVLTNVHQRLRKPHYDSGLVFQQVKLISQRELLDVISLRKEGECLASQEEEVEIQFAETQHEFEVKVKDIEALAQQLREEDALDYDRITAEVDAVRQLEMQHTQLELYLEEKQDLLSVQSHQPRPLTKASSEKALHIDFERDTERDAGFPSRTASMSTIPRKELKTFRGLPTKRSISSNSGTSLDSLNSCSFDSLDPFSSKENVKRSAAEKKRLSMAAKSVTERLYKTPSPRQDLKGNFLKSKREPHFPSPPPHYHRSHERISPMKVTPQKYGSDPMRACPVMTSRSNDALLDDSNSSFLSPIRLRPRRARSFQFASASSLASVPEAVWEEELVKNSMHSEPNVSVDTSCVKRRAKRRDRDFERPRSEPDRRVLAELEQYQREENVAVASGFVFQENVSTENLVWEMAEADPLEPAQLLSSSDSCQFGSTHSIPSIFVADYSDSTGTDVTVRSASLEKDAQPFQDDISGGGSPKPGSKRSHKPPSYKSGLLWDKTRKRLKKNKNQDFTVEIFLPRGSPYYDEYMRDKNCTGPEVIDDSKSFTDTNIGDDVTHPASENEVISEDMDPNISPKKYSETKGPLDLDASHTDIDFESVLDASNNALKFEEDNSPFIYEPKLPSNDQDESFSADSLDDSLEKIECDTESKFGPDQSKLEISDDGNEITLSQTPLQANKKVPDPILPLGVKSIVTDTEQRLPHVQQVPSKQNENTIVLGEGILPLKPQTTGTEHDQSNLSLLPEQREITLPEERFPVEGRELLAPGDDEHSQVSDDSLPASEAAEKLRNLQQVLQQLNTAK